MRRTLTVLAAVAGLIVALAGPARAAVVPQVDITGTYICLTNHNTSCVDVKDDQIVAGTPVWVFSLSGSRAAGWFKASRSPGVCAGEASCGGQFQPFTNSTLDQRYDGDTILIFSVNNDRALCLGESSGNPQLRSNCTAPNTLWVLDSNLLINVERTNIVGGVRILTALGTDNMKDITLDPPNTTGTWQKWSFFCPNGGC